MHEKYIKIRQLIRKENIIKIQREKLKIVLTNMAERDIIYLIQKKYERRLIPLDNVKDSTTQYVSGMADNSSHRISLIYKR